MAIMLTLSLCGWGGVVQSHFCHTRAPSWILSKAENLASSSLQDGATKWLYNAAGTTHPPHQLEMRSKIEYPISTKYVRCPPPSQYAELVICTGSLFLCAVSPPIGPPSESMCGVPRPLLAPFSENMLGPFLRSTYF